MHLLDFILVLVLIPRINANKPIANESCGHLEVQTPSLLFYGRNVTITFKAYNYKNATAQLIYNDKQAISYEPHHHDNQTDIFTFLLLQNRTDKQFHDYNVKYDKCSSGSIRFKMREPPVLGPRNDIEGCNGCLIASVGDKTDAFKNMTQVIGCSMSNATSWTVFITINNKSREARYSHGKYGIDYTVEKDDHMTSVECSMTFQNLTLVDTAILYVKGISTTPSQSPKPDLTNGVSFLNTKQDVTSSALITQSSTAISTTQKHLSTTQSVVLTTQKPHSTTPRIVSTTQKPFSTTPRVVPTTQKPRPTKPRVVPTSSPSDALKTTDNFTPITKTEHGRNDKRTDTTSTMRSEPNSNNANTASIDTTILNPSASNDGFRNVIIAVACAVSALIIVIAIVIVVVCVKRKRRSVANVPVQDALREDQVAQQEGYARIEGAECQYAVVNKPKKLSTLQTKKYPRVENVPMETQSKLEKPRGAGELIYADLDKEALTAKPSNSKPAGTRERPRTPTEYVGIDFARTVALQDTNKQDE